MKQKKMQIIDEKDVPVRIKRKSAEWLEMFLKIPKGKAWVLTEEEAGVKAVSIKSIVNRLKAIGELPDSYKAAQRTGKDGKVTVYVLNSAEDTEETETPELGEE